MKTALVILFLAQVIFTVPGAEGRCPYPRIKNGYLKRKPGNSIAFFCISGFKRYGPRNSECKDNNWTASPPVCVALGCPSIPSNPNRDMDFTHNDAVVMFTCMDNFVLVGKATVYCDGKVWSAPAPECRNPGDIDVCDFEDGEYCGWEQDQTDTFDWTRHSGETNTGRTGPDSDHTLGPSNLGGHYIYMESSVPRVPGDVARLLSPVYPPSKSGRCFRFWYHMKGPKEENNVGSLTISLRLLDGNPDTMDEVLFTVKGNQGRDWKKGDTFIYRTDKHFRIIMTATRQLSYMGDIAVDDISLYDCQDFKVTTTTHSTAEMTSSTVELGTTVLAIKNETTEVYDSEQTSTYTGSDETTAYHVTTETSAVGLMTSNTKSYRKSTDNLTTEISVTQHPTQPGSDATTMFEKLSSTSQFSNIISSSNPMFSSPDIVSVTHQSSLAAEDNFEAETASPHDRLTIDSFDISTTVEQASTTEDAITEETNKTLLYKYAYKQTPKPTVRKSAFQTEGTIHTLSFVVSLTAGIAVIVVGALIIAFIVHRMKKQTKHYRDDDFETMHTATYRKQSTDVLI
ncbi:uncharacterized protein [Argopecten irradians]|uniref:uncharacterized protein n=1 Tax=Argopecten irradians TaxID=31199 RepID=UPI00371A7A99